MRIIEIVASLFLMIVLLVDMKKSKKNPVDVKIKLIEGGKLPEFKTAGAVCADAYARLERNIFIKKGERKLIPLGFACGLPEGYELQVRPRSGLTSKGTDNGWGTGDTDYTGEYMACVINNSDKDFPVCNGDRICQIAIREVPKVKFTVVEELEKTERGSKGFGSSGIR